MKIALVGHGKMGRLLERLAPEFGFEVGAVFKREDNLDGRGLEADRLEGIQGALEFTSPTAAAANLNRLAANRIPTVCGTTGWYHELESVRSRFLEAGASFVWGSNFSIGMVCFERIVSAAAALFSRQNEYGAWAWEIHHRAKRDSPSGTLLHLVERMKTSGYTREIDLAASRAGSVPGTHEIGFDSPADTVTLRHAARSREGFARGALQALQWLAQEATPRVAEFRELVLENAAFTDSLPARNLSSSLSEEPAS